MDDVQKTMAIYHYLATTVDHDNYSYSGSGEVNYNGVSIIVDNRDDLDVVTSSFNNDPTSQTVNMLVNIDQYEDIIEYIVELGAYDYIETRNYFGPLSLNDSQYNEIIIQKI